MLNGHPHPELLREAVRERDVVDNSAEGHALREAIYHAVNAYSEFLDKHGLIFDDGRLKATALVVTRAFGGPRPGATEILLQDGAIDRVYANGRNPDPDGLGPPDFTHERRPNVF